MGHRSMRLRDARARAWPAARRARSTREARARDLGSWIAATVALDDMVPQCSASVSGSSRERTAPQRVHPHATLGRPQEPHLHSTLSDHTAGGA